MICEATRQGEEVLAELRLANPVDAESLPSSRSPESASRLQEILESIDQTPKSVRTRRA